MNFGYTIVYVPDVDASLQFFEAAFAAHELGGTNCPDGILVELGTQMVG